MGRLGRLDHAAAVPARLALPPARAASAPASTTAADRRSSRATSGTTRRWRGARPTRHISPEEAARIANDANVAHLAFYHLLPAPDGWLPRQLFARGVNQVRSNAWTIADDGSLYTLPLGSRAVRVGRVEA